jgi:hypothetical protein
MSITDCMLGNRTASGRRVLRFGASLEEISVLIEKAQRLQQSGMQLKLSGDHRGAVAVYRELLGVVRELEQLGALSWPYGLPTQVVQRAIELEENDGVIPYELHPTH